MSKIDRRSGAAPAGGAQALGRRPGRGRLTTVRADFFLDPTERLSERERAVMSAMLEHIGFVSGAEFSHHEWFAPLIARLEIGPAIFFMISGFLLYRAFCAAAFAGRAPTSPRVFFRRRVLRIFPAYWIALTAILLSPFFNFSTCILARLHACHVQSPRAAEEKLWLETTVPC